MKFGTTCGPKISFSQISQKLWALAHMLLHNSYINVAIAVILLYRKSLYDLQEPRYKNLIFVPEGYLEVLPCRAGTTDTNFLSK